MAPAAVKAHRRSAPRRPQPPVPLVPPRIHTSESSPNQRLDSLLLLFSMVFLFSYSYSYSLLFLFYYYSLTLILILYYSKPYSLFL